MRNKLRQGLWQRWTIRVVVGFVVLAFIVYRTLQVLGWVAHAGRR